MLQDGQVELQSNNRQSGSGSQTERIISAIGLSSPLVVSMSLAADDNFPISGTGTIITWWWALKTWTQLFRPPNAPSPWNGAPW